MHTDKYDKIMHMKRFVEQVLTYLDLLIFLLFIIVLESALKYCVNMPLIQLKPLVVNGLLFAMFTGVLIIFNRKIRLLIETLLMILLTIYSFAQSYHFAFFETFFSFSKITMLSELNGVKNEIFNKLDIKYLVFLFVLLMWFVFFILIKKIKVNEQNAIIAKVIIASFLLLISTYSYQKIFELPNVNENELILSEEYLYSTMTNKNRFINRFGTIAYIYRDSIINLNKKDITLSNDELTYIQEYIANNQIESNEYTGIFEGKNLIFVLAESLCPEAIDEKLTPTLYKMSQEGYYFTNFYAPLYPANTNDSEFITLTSLIPSIEDGTTSKVFGSNVYPYSLANLFNKKGYNSNSYHSFIKAFYNREPFHTALGFNKFYDRDDLGIVLETYHEDYINWSDDKELFETMMSHTDIDEPFFNFVISASGHLPYMHLRWELNHNLDNDNLKEFPEELQYYFSSQMKLDEGLEHLIDILDKQGILKDTVIVVMGDHYPYGLAKEESHNYIYQNDSYEFEKYHVPLIIFNAALNGEENNKLGSNFDITPTITNMFNLETDNGYYIGNDLFSNKKSRVLFSDYSYLTIDYYYDANDSSVISFKETTNYDKEIVEIKNIYRISQLILKSNYFKAH